MLLKGLWLVETITFFLLSFLIPKDKYLIIFWCRKWTSIIWNPKIFYRYLKYKHPWKYKLYFYDKNRVNTDALIHVYWNNLLKYWKILRAQYIIIDNCSFDVWMNGVLVWNFNTIQTRHWEAIKWIWFLSTQYLKRRSKIVLFFEKLEYKNYKYILSNPATTKIFSWVFNKAQNVIGIWLPRNDLLLHANILNLVKNKTVETQIINWKKEFKKVILLAPTFRETDSSDYFTQEEAENLNKVLERSNFLVIIKTHPNETRKFLHKKYSNLINITKIHNFDATDFTPFVDMVMTDYSSIYIDFLLTWKPVIFYQKDLDDYINKERWLLYKPEQVVIKETTAYSFYELLNIFENLERNIKKEEYKKWYKNLYNLFFKWLDINISTCEKLDNLLLK